MDKETIEKYFGDSKGNPIKEIEERLSKDLSTDEDDVFLFNHITGAIVKLRRNGMIDIFSKGNNGIRIDPSTNSVNFFANDEKHNIGNLDVWAERNIRLSASKDIDVYSPNFNIHCHEDNVKIGTTSIGEISNLANINEIRIKKLQNKINTMEDTINDMQSIIVSLQNEINELKNGE